MTIEASLPRFHAGALLLQLALAAFAAPLVQAHDEGPDYAPPPPPAVAPPPAPQPRAAPPVDGQWVNTSQYGWVWMPYARSYTYVPAQGDPVMFVYGTGLGWHWVAAPWIFDYGPAPYWGPRGRAYFSWYARPWFSRRGYHRDYHQWRGQRARDNHRHEHGRHR